MKTCFKLLSACIMAATLCGCCETMEIHHISTGRGNCTYLIMPDGTTMMIDCGDDPDCGAVEHNEMQPMLPDSLESTARHIMNYIAGVAPEGKEKKLDYFFPTHFHSDHLWAFPELAKELEIGKIIDRAYPDYPTGEDKPDIDEYVPAVREAVAAGTKAELFRVGALDQFKMVGKGSKGFSIRNLCANGECWTGEGEESARIYGHIPGDENANSCGILLNWGDFSYLTCGDIPGGYMAPDDMQTAVSKVCGNCDIVVACHHGYQESMIEPLCKAADAKAYVAMTREYWHPSGAAVDNMCDPELHTGDPKIFCTWLLQSQKDNFRELGVLDHFAPAGHVVIKVGGHGRWFQILVRDASSTDAGVIYKTAKIRS